MNYLDKIRVPQKSDSTKRQIILTIGILLLGICMGTFSKYLDYTQGHLPGLLQAIDNALDLHNFLGGFAPWIAYTIVSPFLGFLCWYAKGKGWVALILSAGILGVLVNTAFAYGMFYINIRSWLNLLMLLLGILILRKSVKETICMMGLSIVFALIFKTVVPFFFW